MVTVVRIVTNVATVTAFLNRNVAAAVVGSNRVSIVDRSVAVGTEYLSPFYRYSIVPYVRKTDERTEPMRVFETPRRRSELLAASTFSREYSSRDRRKSNSAALASISRFGFFYSLSRLTRSPCRRVFKWSNVSFYRFFFCFFRSLGPEARKLFSTKNIGNVGYLHEICVCVRVWGGVVFPFV